MEDSERLKKYVSVVPNDRQLIVQDMRFYAFVHFTVNTFTGKEWGNGRENPSIFNPVGLDTDQWCKAIKAAEMKGVILTAKHHDGFCLWQTATTEHCIKNSPYKNGKGDVVAELAKSCKKYGLKLGIYLSPWDRNSRLYGTDGYNDLYINQLTELLDGRYGDIFMLWLDGACAAHKDGKPVQKYDFPRIWSTALRLQPNICMSGCAPDVRWVGNESGKARESEWNVVPQFSYQYQNIAANCQDDDDMKKFQKRCEDVMLPDMGSREFLADYDEFMWYPSEVDVSIRLGWFNHGALDFTTKSLRRLMNIYFKAVGGNSLLLLNVPPNKKGLFSARDVKRLERMGEEIRKLRQLAAAETDYPEYAAENGKYVYRMKFDKTVIDRIWLEEDTTKSQRVENFSVSTFIGGKRKPLAEGTVIGFGKYVGFGRTETDNIEIEITRCRFEPYVKKIIAIRVGGYKMR